MGISYCYENRNKFGSNSINKVEDRLKEVEINGYPMIKININLRSVVPSVCKIIFKNIKGSGFLIKLENENKALFCLMTNEHVVSKEMIEKNEIINIYYNNEKKKISINLNTE